MIEIQFDWIWGLVFGIEHLTDENAEYEWLIPIHLGFFRILIIKHQPFMPV